MPNLLLTWIGHADLRAATDAPAAGLGPIAQAVTWERFDAVHLLSDYPPERTAPFLVCLASHTPAPLHLHPAPLSRPTAFSEIYAAVRAVVDRVLASHKAAPTLTFHLSPGTPAMAAVWIILGKTRYPARLIQSSPARGVEVASVPFDLAADFVPDLLAARDARLRESAAASPPAAPAFAAIVHRSTTMARLVERARRVAARDVPVLLEGESGTGKELFARAIHIASPRAGRPFVAVNCGAIPAELVESELFGHTKGAFSGATHDRRGHFREADGGTLFLDELGELPLPAQVKLLRALQEREVVPVGASKPVAVDVRIVAATHRELLREATAGRFRADLFYRLAVAILVLPPLREREGDLGLLIDTLLDAINREHRDQPGYIHKDLSASARNLLLRHDWPGNVRELANTLQRAALWSSGALIDADDVREALLPHLSTEVRGLLGRPLGEGLDLRVLQAELARHYLERALAEAGGNKTRAAELVGLPSYQTFTNWMEKYGIEP